jgi:cytochrome b561
MIRNNSTRWGHISIGLHWLTAVLIVGLAVVGLIMTELPNSAFKMQVYALHKSFGLTVLKSKLWKAKYL